MSVGEGAAYECGQSGWRALRLVAIAVAAGALLAALAPGPARAAPHGDILLITVDTLRADHVGAYGYDRDTTPYLDRFFSHGAIYTRSYSTAANTSPSLVSILSGEVPQVHGVRLLYQLLSKKVRLIPDDLPRDYQKAAVVSNLVLTREALGIGDRFDHYDDYVDESAAGGEIYERRAARTTDAALHWLRTKADPRRPVFLWVHYMDPHGPYHPPGKWLHRFHHDEPLPIDIARIPPYERFAGVTDGRTYVDRYDGEIAYTDHAIGRLLDAYAKLRPLDKTLVVFTADHGETLMEHERWFTHGIQVYEDLVRVPLMLRGPGVKPGRCDLPVQSTDIAPTIVRFAGAPLPSNLLHTDLRSRKGIPKVRRFFVEATQAGGQWRGVVEGDRKWILEIVGPRRRIVAGRRYDLATDPHELYPQRWRAQSAPPQKLLQLVRTDPDPAGIPPDLRKGMQITAPKVDPRAPASVRKQLKALGYVE